MYKTPQLKSRDVLSHDGPAPEEAWENITSLKKGHIGRKQPDTKSVISAIKQGGNNFKEPDIQKACRRLTGEEKENYNIANAKLELIQ